MILLNLFKKPKQEDEKYSRYIDRMKAQDYIDSTRLYLDYVEEHLQYVAKAFAELSDACDGKEHWVGDDSAWYSLKAEVECHDLSKLSKYELVQYRDNFFPVKSEDKEKSGFKDACNHHVKNNHHHHESVRNYTDIVHMVIDWMAMSYKFGGCPHEYYLNNKHKMNIKAEYHDYIETLFLNLKDFRVTISCN